MLMREDKLAPLFSLQARWSNPNPNTPLVTLHPLQHSNFKRQMLMHRNKYLPRFVSHLIVTLLGQPGDDRVLLYNVNTA